MLVPPLNTVLDSDHRMVTASLRLKLKKYTNTTRATRYNVQALHSAETAQRFNNELTCLLGDLDGSDDIIKHWNNIKSSLQTAAEKILCEPKKHNKPWIGHETFALIDKRSRARAKLSKAKIRREIKQCARTKHGTTPSSQTKSSPRMKVGTLAKCTRSSRSSQASVRLPPIYSKTNVDTISPTKKKKIETWANHFQNLLNIPSANSVPIAPTVGPLSCFFGPPILRRNPTCSQQAQEQQGGRY